MNPYYQDDLTTIYHGDCAEIAPSLGRFDLLLTDPPYGIGESSKKQRSREQLAAPTDFGFNDWDAKPPARELLDSLREQAQRQIIWGGNFFDLPPTSCVLVWDKDNSGDFADCELAWTNFRKAVRKFTYRWNGMLQEPGYPKEKRVHPTQKPLPLMHWCLGFAPDAKTVLDPFMGSGTTLLACKQKGIKCVGIEREKQYCDRAIERLSQSVLNLFG